MKHELAEHPVLGPRRERQQRDAVGLGRFAAASTASSSIGPTIATTLVLPQLVDRRRRGVRIGRRAHLDRGRRRCRRSRRSTSPSATTALSVVRACFLTPSGSTAPTRIPDGRGRAPARRAAPSAARPRRARRWRPRGSSARPAVSPFCAASCASRVATNALLGPLLSSSLYTPSSAGAGRGRDDPVDPRSSSTARSVGVMPLGRGRTARRTCAAPTAACRLRRRRTPTRRGTRCARRRSRSPLSDLTSSARAAAVSPS